MSIGLLWAKDPCLDPGSSSSQIGLQLRIAKTGSVPILGGEGAASAAGVPALGCSFRSSGYLARALSEGGQG